MNFADLVKDTSASTGTGNFTLSGAVSAGFQMLSALGAVGATFGYAIGLGTAEWECGKGTITGANTFSRAPTASSNGGALVNFSAGTKIVAHVVTADAFKRGLNDPTDVGFDIILCAGQSNMVGLGAIDPVVDIHDPRVFQFGGWSTDATYQKIVSGADPLKFTTENANLGPASWFGKTYAGMVPGNRKVLLVPVGQGGTYLVQQTAEWAPGTPGGSYYEKAISQTNAAVAAAMVFYPNSRVVGTIWRQGESDGDWGVPQATYASALKSLIAGFRSRITGATDSWFIIMGMLPEAIAFRNGTYPAINLAHIQVANETRHCAFVPAASGHQNGDNLHADGVGQRIMGCAAAAKVYEASLFSGVDNIAPTPASASVANGSPYTVTISASELLHTGFTPDISTLTLGGHALTAVAVSGAGFALTTATPFVFGEAARMLAYVKPASNGFRDLSGNLMESFTALAVVNNVQAADTTKPTFVSAEVTNAAPNAIRITMSETLFASSVPSASTIAAALGRTVSGVAFADNIILATVGAAYANGDTITVGYTKPGSGNVLRDAANNQTDSFGPVTVTNNVAAAAVLTKQRLTTLVNMLETGTAPNYVYNGSSNYGAPVGGQPAGVLNGPGEIRITINKLGGRPLLALNASAGIKAYNEVGYHLLADNAAYGGFGSGPAPTIVISNRAPVETDVMRLLWTSASVTNLFAQVSSDGGTSWTTIRTWDNVTGPLYPQAASDYGNDLGRISTMSTVGLV